MNDRPISRPCFVTAVALACASVGAQAQTQVVQQVLDRVVVYNGAAVLEMKFNDSERLPPDFTKFNLDVASRLSSCQLNSKRGLFCLHDGKDVLQWSRPETSGASALAFSCSDGKLRLDNGACTALAVARTGDVWVAGRRGKTYVLVRLTESGGSPCSVPTQLASSSRYCFQEYAAGRPLLSKLVVVEGTQAETFDPGTGSSSSGVLGLEPNAVTFFGPVAGTRPVDLVKGSGAWGLSGKESLTDLALLQQQNGTETDNYLLVTTSSGRVLARQTDVNASRVAVEAFNVPLERAGPPASTACASAAGFGIVASADTGSVYVTDRSYCEVLALRPVGPPFGGLVNAVSVDPASPTTTADLTLSTSSATAGIHAPDGATVAPGVIIKLVDCAGECTLVTNSKDQRIAWLQGVALNTRTATTPTEPYPTSPKMVLFQVQNIPDCRYIPTDADCRDADGNLIAGVVVSDTSGRRYLDVAKLLPPEVEEQFRATYPDEPWVPLLMSPEYRGRRDNGYKFGVLFGIPEKGVVFEGYFSGELDIEQLVGRTSTLDRCNAAPGDDTTAELVQWDVVTYTSERFIAPGGVDLPDNSNPYSYVDTLVNDGCGTTRIKPPSWSMLSFGVELAYADVPATPVDEDDDIFARLVLKLFDELKITQTQLACASDVDGAGSRPLTAAQCSSLNASLLLAEDKLLKCVAATRQPKTSAVDQNCRSFEVQFDAYEDELVLIGPNTRTADPANRIGSLKARTRTLWWVYGTRFLPSVPPGGFVE